MIKKTIFGDSLKKRLLAHAKDRLHSFVLADGTVRGAMLRATRMIHEMRANHELGVLETLVLGHAYLGCGLMSANLKGDDRISLEIDCTGPIKGLSVETNAFGEVRGYLKNVPIPVEAPLTDLNLSPFFGAGFLSVTRYLQDAKQPFTGKVALAYGSIAKDLAYYHLASEQTPTAFSLSIQFDADGQVTGAGGLFLQALPGAKDGVVSKIETLVAGLPSLGGLFSRDEDAQLRITEAFGALCPRFLGSRRMEFMCHCRPDRVRTMLLMLPLEELRDLKANGPFPVEIRCHNCNTSYTFAKPVIERIFRERFPRN
jgi:molecular chaperone Hsp33